MESDVRYFELQDRLSCMGFLVAGAGIRVLDYSKWENFSKVIKRAMIALGQTYFAIQTYRQTELIANLFRISQTEEKLRKDEVEGADIATNVHYNVGKEVRTAIEKIGGTMPDSN